ncbi:MAG: hypothetical protein V4696_00800 [Pseudomonadota bacterium]
MHRLTRAQIVDLIAVVLATANPNTKRRMVSKLPIEADQGRAEMAELIARQIDNDGSMVVVTEMVGEAHVARRGTWGVDEVAPAVVANQPSAPVPEPSSPDAA